MQKNYKISIKKSYRLEYVEIENKKTSIYEKYYVYSNQKLPAKYKMPIINSHSKIKEIERNKMQICGVFWIFQIYHRKKSNDKKS